MILFVEFSGTWSDDFISIGSPGPADYIPPLTRTLTVTQFASDFPEGSAGEQ